MLFNSIDFIFVFLPVVFILFYGCPAKFRLAILFFSSIAFYATSGDMALLLLVLATAWAVLAAFLVQRWNVGLAAFIAVFPPLGLLFLFKYLDFSTSILDPSGGSRDFFSFILRYTIPAGISFYTFQIVSYLIDIRRGTVPVERNLLLVGTFVTLFPQLIAGPILRFHEIRDQLRHISETAQLRPDIAKAIKYFAIGLTYKIFFADVLRAFHEQHKIEAGGGALDSVYAVFAYSFIIYFDFWSYSLMAIGIAGLFCLRLPRNFREPYLAKTPKDFWRRWHVTLSFWLRDYVYLPLGGNRRYIVNIAIIFILCGIWHGAGWNFIVWGAYHAVLIIIYRITRTFWDRLPGVLQIGVTFVAVSLGWPLFYLDVAGYLDILSMNVDAQAPTNVPQFGIWHWLYLTGIACWTFLTREDKWLFNETPVRLFDSPVLHGVLFSISVLFLYFGRTFIYFNF